MPPLPESAAQTAPGLFVPSSQPYTQQPGFQRAFQPGALRLGLFFPIEAFAGDTPRMQDQVQAAQRAEALGFAALWLRDVLLRDPHFGDTGQVFDPWVYLGYMAAHTQHIALGTASIVLPIRHPLHTAKAAASVDQLSQGRLLLGVASGDRPVEFPAFGVDEHTRDAAFRDHIAVLRQAHASSFAPLHWPGGAVQGADLVPKPTTAEVPLLVTGHSRQPLDWIARHSHGWISYPRAPQVQARIVQEWRQAVQAQCPGVFKPFVQSLYIDLEADPQAPPSPIHLGWRLGREALHALLLTLQEMGVNHVILNLKYGRRPALEVMEEVGSQVLPYLHTMSKNVATTAQEAMEKEVNQ